MANSIAGKQVRRGPFSRGRFRVEKGGCEDGQIERAWFEYAPKPGNYRQRYVTLFSGI